MVTWAYILWMSLKYAVSSELTDDRCYSPSQRGGALTEHLLVRRTMEWQSQDSHMRGAHCKGLPPSFKLCCKNCLLLGKLFSGFSGVVKSCNLIMMEMASPALATLTVWSFTTSDYANLNPLQHGNISTCDDHFTFNFLKDWNL